MEKYILQILENNSRVILPEFGAFIIKQKNPIIIVFNEFLQYNDGVMVDTIAKNEGIDRDAAKKKIDDFIKEINSQLDKGTPFVIDDLGALVKSSNGKISLEKDTSRKTGKTTDTKKTEKEQPPVKKASAEPEKPAEKEKKETIAKTSATEEKKEVKEVPVEKKDKPEEKIKEEAEIPKKPVKEEKQKEKSIQKPPAKAPVPPTISGSNSKQEESESGTKVSSKNISGSKASASGAGSTSTRGTGTYTARTTVHPKETKKKTNLWLWVIIILIVNGIIISYFIMSDQLSGLFKKTDKVSAPEIQDMTKSSEEKTADDVLIIEPEGQIIEEEPVVPETKSKPQPAVTGKRYYIVAGVFREEQNADNLVVELHKKGYKAEKFGKIGSLYAVSFGVYTSKSDADREMQRIKQEENPEAWIKVMN